MKLVGADAGKKGSCCLHDTTQPGCYSFFDMPLREDNDHDTHTLFMHLMEFEPDVLVTELTVKNIKLIRHTGELVGLAKILQANPHLVPVNSWKKKVLGVVTSDKNVSIAKALELCPTLELVKPRCRVPSHDRAEAFLLVQWYLLTHPGAVGGK